PPPPPPPPPQKDDSSLPGLGPGLSQRKGAQSARRVRSLSPNIQRASTAERAGLGSVRPQSRGGPGVGGGGSAGRVSFLLDAKQSDSRRGDSDREVNPGASSSIPSDGDRRRAGGGGGELAAERGGGEGDPPHLAGEVAEAKSDATGARPARLPGTTSTSPSRERRGSRRCSSTGGLADTSLSSTSTNERCWSTWRFKQQSNLTTSTKLLSGGVFPDDGDRFDGHRREHQHRETKDCGSTPSIPSIERGEDSSRSPRTRRMRPQIDSTA
ncbi:unnamed protein product, partial [Hapterophycus canaliculatus]